MTGGGVGNEPTFLVSPTPISVGPSADGAESGTNVSLDAVALNLGLSGASSVSSGSIGAAGLGTLETMFPGPETVTPVSVLILDSPVSMRAMAMGLGLGNASRVYSSDIGTAGLGVPETMFPATEAVTPVSVFIMDGPSPAGHAVVIVYASQQPVVLRLGGGSISTADQVAQVIALLNQEHIALTAAFAGQGPLPGGTSSIFWKGQDQPWDLGPSTTGEKGPVVPETIDGKTEAAPAPAAPARTTAPAHPAPAGAAAEIPLKLKLDLDLLDRGPVARPSADARAGGILGRDVLDEASGTPSASLLGVAAVVVVGHELALRENRRFSGRRLTARSWSRAISRRATWTAGPGPRTSRSSIQSTPWDGP